MASRRPIIIGNWKLHNTIAEATSLAVDVKNALASLRDVDYGIAPVFTSLAPVAKRIEDSKLLLGAQDCHFEERGAHTGEVAPSMLTDVGCSFVIVGHSERRASFGDTDAVVGKKMRAAIDAGLTAVVCVGESEAEREAGKTTERIDTQLGAILGLLEAKDLSKFVIAYEPIWAIGTGKTASPAQAQEVHAFIRKQLVSRFGDAGNGIRLQYGGSVKPANAEALLSQEDIDGALVGGASLKAEDFAAIVKAARG